MPKLFKRVDCAVLFKNVRAEENGEVWGCLSAVCLCARSQLVDGLTSALIPSLVSYEVTPVNKLMHLSLPIAASGFWCGVGRNLPSRSMLW
jgi:hypothetical protein